MTRRHALTWAAATLLLLLPSRPAHAADPASGQYICNTYVAVPFEDHNQLACTITLLAAKQRWDAVPGTRTGADYWGTIWETPWTVTVAGAAIEAENSYPSAVNMTLAVPSGREPVLTVFAIDAKPRPDNIQLAPMTFILRLPAGYRLDKGPEMLGSTAGLELRSWTQVNGSTLKVEFGGIGFFLELGRGPGCLNLLLTLRKS
jgi:hypothetical protein